MKLLTSWLLLLATCSIMAQQSLPLDTLLQRAYVHEDSSDIYFKLAYKKLKIKADTANYLYFKLFRWDQVQNEDSVTAISKQLIPLLNQIDSLERLRKVYSRLHYQELRAGRYEGALHFIQEALTVSERMKDTNMIALHLSDKAIIYHDFEDYEKGVEVGKRAYSTADMVHDKDFKYLIFANNAIAINFDDWGKADSALFYHYKNVKLLSKIEDTVRYSFVYNNLGNTLLKSEKYPEAKKYIQRALVLNKIRNRPYNLATNYTNLATIAFHLNKNVEAKEYFLLANQYAEESKSIEKIRDVIQQEAWFYKKIGDYKTALEKQEAFYVLRDSVFNQERANMVAEIETKYETEKKERDLAETRATLAESKLELLRKNRMFYGSIGLLVVLVVIGYMLYKQQKIRTAQVKREAELKEALARIETQNQLQEQRLRISRDLHDNIGSQLTFVTSSLDNLKYRIGDSDNQVSDKLESISDFTTKTIYELRDTIWAMNKEWITVEDLKSRISNFIQMARKAREGVHFEFNADAIELAMEMPSIYGMNVYRIIQEAVNNALKYADATMIKVVLESHDGSLIFKVVDNGKGFDSASVEKGNGILNIEKRAKDLGGVAEITSNRELGTEVKIKCPMPHLQ